MALRITPKQRLFAESYIANNNASLAAENAGVPHKSAASMGWQWLKNPKVLAYIDSCRTKLRGEITKEKYIDKALESFEALDITEPNSPRFYDIAGKALGYIGPQNIPSVTNNTQINITLTGQETQEQLWAMTRKLLEGNA